MPETTTNFDNTSVMQHQLAAIFFKLITLVRKNAVTFSGMVSKNVRNGKKLEEEKNLSNNPYRDSVKAQQAAVESDEIETDERKQIALVLYPKVAFLNHSCKPNAFLAFGPNGHVQVKITQTVDPGDEINISYGPMANRKKKIDRQNHLNKFYNFKCRCVICSDVITSNDVDLTLDLANKYKCQGCAGPIQKMDETCSSCPENLLKHRDKIIVRSDKARSFMNDAVRNPSKAFNLLQEAYLLADSVFFEMNTTLSRIRDCLALVGWVEDRLVPKLANFWQFLVQFLPPTPRLIALQKAKL